MTEEQRRSFDLCAPTPEHAGLAETLREFVTREVEPQAADSNRVERFNRELFLQVCEALSTSDPGFALSVLAHAILFAQNILVNGDESQRRRVLPRAASGEWIGGLCMTEPEVGTDVLAMRTRAVREGDHYVIDGTKTFITNGGIDEDTLGDAFVVYAVTGPRQITSFLVEKGTPGFRLGQKWKDKLGIRASFTAELVFDGARVPATNLLGEEGQGTIQMMRNLEIERLTLAAMSVGIAQRCLQVMVAYANERKSFGVPLRDHGQIQRHIAEGFASYRAARTLVYDTARRIDPAATGQRVDADAAKLFAAQVGKRVADSAIQVLGGYGYMGEYVVERLWRDAKLLEIGGGTLEAHQKNLTKDLSRDPALLLR
jgi:isovaleryl-CoA dehydrogenase